MAEELSSVQTAEEVVRVVFSPQQIVLLLLPLTPLQSVEEGRGVRLRVRVVRERTVLLRWRVEQ